MVAPGSLRLAEPLADELAASFEIIGHAPNIGRLYRHSPVPGARRVLLRATRYHVYYVPHADDVRVLAVWHAQRGVGTASSGVVNGAITACA